MAAVTHLQQQLMLLTVHLEIPKVCMPITKMNAHHVVKILIVQLVLMVIHVIVAKEKVPYLMEYVICQMKQQLKQSAVPQEMKKVTI